MPRSKGRSNLGPGHVIFENRTLHLPDLVVYSSSDIVRMLRHLDDLLEALPRLKFIIRSFAKDFIVKQYIVLKYDLYFDTLNHLQGMFHELETEGRVRSDKDRNYWLVVEFIGYQFRLDLKL